MFLVLTGVFGVSSVNAGLPCKNCKNDNSGRNSDNNRVLRYKKDERGKNGVAVAAGVGGEKLSHARLSHAK